MRDEENHQKSAISVNSQVIGSETVRNGRIWFVRIAKGKSTRQRLVKRLVFWRYNNCNKRRKITVHRTPMSHFDYMTEKYAPSLPNAMTLMR